MTHAIAERILNDDGVSLAEREHVRLWLKARRMWGKMAPVVGLTPRETVELPAVEPLTATIGEMLRWRLG